MNTTSLRSALLAPCFLATASLAAPFDGTVPIVCETVEVHDCTPGSACTKTTPRGVSMAEILRIDIGNKKVSSAYRKEPLPIMISDITDERVALQGHERWVVWSAVLRQKDGSLTIAIADRKGSYVIFGKCEARASEPATSGIRQPHQEKGRAG